MAMTTAPPLSKKRKLYGHDHHPFPFQNRESCMAMITIGELLKRMLCMAMTTTPPFSKKRNLYDHDRARLPPGDDSFFFYLTGFPPGDVSFFDLIRKGLA